MSIDPKFVELTADVLEIFLYNIRRVYTRVYTHNRNQGLAAEHTSSYFISGTRYISYTRGRLTRIFVWRKTDGPEDKSHTKTKTPRVQRSGVQQPQNILLTWAMLRSENTNYLFRCPKRLIDTHA